MPDLETCKRYARKVKIFSGLEPEEVFEILRGGQVVKYMQGQTVFHEGSLGNCVFIVLSGQIAIYNHNQEIARCQVGDAFGEMSVIDHRPRCATAAALSDVTLFTMDEDQINQLLHQRVPTRMLLNVIHVLCERLEAADQWIADNCKGRPPRH